MTRPRSLLLPVATVLVGAALLLAGCGASGGEDAKADDTTTTAPATTTAPEDDKTTTTADGSDPGDGPTSDDLEALLPSAADIGDGWKVDTSDDDSDSSALDKAIEEQCPDATALATDDDESTDSVKRSYVDGADRQIQVELSPSAMEVEDDFLDELVTAINDCPDVTFTEGTVTTSLDLEAQTSEDYGDQAVQLHVAASITEASLSEPVTLDLYALVFRTEEVGVRITASDGLDSDTLEVTPSDGDQLTALADNLDQAVAQLVGN